MTSDELTISHAQKHQPWTVPYSQGVDEAKVLVPHILASHTVLHAAKTVGKLAAIFERLDHTDNPQIDMDIVLDIGEIAADLVTEALRLANLYRINLAKVLVEHIQEKNGVNILDIK